MAIRALDEAVQLVAELIVGMAIAGVTLHRHHQLRGGHARDDIAADGIGALRRTAERVGDRRAGTVKGDAAGGAGIAEHTADGGCSGRAVVDEVDDAAAVGLKATADVAAHQIGLAGYGSRTHVSDDLAALAPAAREAVADAFLLVVLATENEVT